MNPWGLDATGLMIWGLVVHLIADWLLQNEWMATKKMLRRMNWGPDEDPARPIPREGRWWDRHPAAYVHAGIHGLLLALVFGWVAAPLALSHLVIDTRVPVEWWSRLIRQTQPLPIFVREGDGQLTGKPLPPSEPFSGKPYQPPRVIVDLGTLVRIWADQVWHVATIAVAALIVGTVS